MEYLIGVILISIAGGALLQADEICQVYSITPGAAETTPGSRALILGEGFSTQTNAYFDGMLARETTFLNSSRLEVVTPYLRPGKHYVQIECGDRAVRSKVIFTALRTAADARIDKALSFADADPDLALALLDEVQESVVDDQVRALVRYQKSRLYFGKGDLGGWRFETSMIYEDSNFAGWGVQKFWPYRLNLMETMYLFRMDGDPAVESNGYDWTVKFDITKHPEPFFFRALVAARTGKLNQAKSDSTFLLKGQPSNPSYLALASFVAAVAGDHGGAEHLRSAARSSLSTAENADARALSLLGEASYISGNTHRAKQDWLAAAKLDPVMAGIVLLGGKKHLWRGEPHIAAMLLNEALAMAAPGSPEAEEAGELLEGIPTR